MAAATTTTMTETKTVTTATILTDSENAPPHFLFYYPFSAAIKLTLMLTRKVYWWELRSMWKLVVIKYSDEWNEMNASIQKLEWIYRQQTQIYIYLQIQTILYIQLNGTLIYSCLQPWWCAHETMKQPSVCWNYLSVFWPLIATWLTAAAIKFIEFRGRRWCMFGMYRKAIANRPESIRLSMWLIFQKSDLILFGIWKILKDFHVQNSVSRIHANIFEK